MRDRWDRPGWDQPLGSFGDPRPPGPGYRPALPGQPAVRGPAGTLPGRWYPGTGPGLGRATRPLAVPVNPDRPDPAFVAGSFLVHWASPLGGYKISPKW